MAKDEYEDIDCTPRDFTPRDFTPRDYTPRDVKDEDSTTGPSPGLGPPEGRMHRIQTMQSECSPRAGEHSDAGACAVASIAVPAIGARGFAKAKKSPAKRRGGPAPMGPAKTNPQMKAATEKHVRAATPFRARATRSSARRWASARRSPPAAPSARCPPARPFSPPSPTTPTTRTPRTRRASSTWGTRYASRSRRRRRGLGAEEHERERRERKRHFRRR